MMVDMSMLQNRDPQAERRFKRQAGSARPWLITLIVIAVVVIAAIGSYTSTYNHMVTLREQVKQQWAQVDVVIQRRADLIPNLVATVKGFAAHETKVIGEITAARAALGGASNRAQTISANNQLDGALSHLLLIVENYPNLKSNRNFLALQDELTGTENRIAVERRRYNHNIQEYNTYIRQFPNNVIANMSGFRYDTNYFHASPAERAAPPKVQFGKP